MYRDIPEISIRFTSGEGGGGGGRWQPQGTPPRMAARNGNARSRRSYERTVDCEQ